MSTSTYAELSLEKQAKALTPKPPAVIAFTESGTRDGGSMSWLLSAFKCLDRSRFTPIVICNYAAKCTTLDRIREMGIPVFLACDKDPDYYPRAIRKTTGVYPLRKVRTLCRIFYRYFVRDAGIVLRMNSIMKQHRAAAVVLNSDVHMQYPGILAARMRKLPMMVRKSGGINEGHWLKKHLTKYIAVFVCVSKAAEDDQKLSPDTKRTVLVPEGVNIAEYNKSSNNPALRKELGIPEGKMVVTNIARIQEGKGQVELVDAAAKVLREFPEAAFLIVGEESEASAPVTHGLREQIVRLGLEGKVLLPGVRGDVADVLAVSDVFVHCPTTWIEGLAICHLEALAASRPCVISRNGGLAEAALHGVTAFMVEPGDIDAMADGILKLLRDPDLRARFGKAARARAEQLFDIETNNRIYEEVLDEMLASSATVQ